MIQGEDKKKLTEELRKRRERRKRGYEVIQVKDEKRLTKRKDKVRNRLRGKQSWNF